jgi:hypothetical protein
MGENENYKDYLKNQLNLGVALIQKHFSVFPKGEIEEKRENGWITLSYDAGKPSERQDQKYIHIAITGDFNKNKVAITYYLKISDNLRPFVWDSLEKFESSADSGIIAFDRWILTQLRKKEEEMKDKFAYFFGDFVKVVGNWGITECSKELLKMIIEGALKLKKEIILVEISHTEGHQKPISFAVYEGHDWLLFPEFCNEGDSGEGGGGYFELNQFLNEPNKKGIIKWYIDIETNSFETKIKESNPTRYGYDPEAKKKPLVDFVSNNARINKLIEESNKCFRKECFLASAFMIRKIIEDSLRIELEELQESIKNKEGNFKSSNELLDNEKIKPFLDKYLIKRLKEINYLEGLAVHDHEYEPEELEIEAKVLVQFLGKLFPKTSF